ncbi:MAG: COX15/CtaA family protein [Planctomycetales bacterium]|nr:COX15/CtaA family protein [Planctomycetales bacterium]
MDQPRRGPGEGAQAAAGQSPATSQEPLTTAYSRVPHALAVVLTVAVFPLIWVGGLVTTYDAGMAVPDWPGTYGWNMFAYPVSTWLYGPFDLLVEHSHRLLGSLAGFLSIGLVLAAFRYDARRWFRWWCVGVLLAVVAQGLLGGARVVLDQRTFAMIHGCTGPLFFAMATATAVVSSRWWVGHCLPGSTRRWVAWWATALVAASYSQLIVGAQLRHVTAAISHSAFMGFVHMHLTLAALVSLLALVLAAFLTFSRRMTPAVRWPAQLLAAVVVVQIGLGIGTWIVNYALPWSEMTDFLAEYTILAKGYWESFMVTAHMATGSLVISLATVVALRAWRSSQLVRYSS